MCILGKSKDFKYVALGGNFQAETEFNFPPSQWFIKKKKEPVFNSFRETRGSWKSLNWFVRWQWLIGKILKRGGLGQSFSNWPKMEIIWEDCYAWHYSEYCNQTIHGVRVFSVVGSDLQYTQSQSHLNRWVILQLWFWRHYIKSSETACNLWLTKWESCC